MDMRDNIPDPQEGRTVWYGEFAEAATDMADPVTVIIPEFDPHLQWGPVL